MGRRTAESIMMVLRAYGEGFWDIDLKLFSEPWQDFLCLV